VHAVVTDDGLDSPRRPTPFFL